MRAALEYMMVAELKKKKNYRKIRKTTKEIPPVRKNNSNMTENPVLQSADLIACQYFHLYDISALPAGILWI
jgi:hypothetical protein